MTRERDAGGGGRWISGRRSASWRRGRRGCAAAATGWSSRRSRGRGTMPAFTRTFEDQVAWLAVHTNKTAVSDLMRIAWRSVGWICQRIAVEAQAQRDLLSCLERIGFDEIAIRKGQRYLTGPRPSRDCHPCCRARGSHSDQHAFRPLTGRQDVLA
jgi:Helix-turn-helix domain of transposase family ISL3